MAAQKVEDQSTPTKLADFAEVSAYTIAHMNEDHRQNLLDYAQALAGLTWAEAAEMTAVDPHGFELLVRGGDRIETVRIPFGEAVTTPARLRPTLVKLAKQSRRLLAQPK